MIIRRLGLAIGAAALMLSGLTALPAAAEDPVGTQAYRGCTRGLYWSGGTTGYKAWTKCSLPRATFQTFMQCREGYSRYSAEYPATGKTTAWTVGGCPTKPRDYGAWIFN